MKKKEKKIKTLTERVITRICRERAILRCRKNLAGIKRSDGSIAD